MFILPTFSFLYTCILRFKCVCVCVNIYTRFAVFKQMYGNEGNSEDKNQCYSLLLSCFKLLPKLWFHAKVLCFPIPSVIT